VTSHLPPERCGIGDYTARLAAELAPVHDVSVLASRQPAVDIDSRVRLLPTVDDWGFRGVRALCGRVRDTRPDWVCIEYVPYLYSRLGMNLWLPFAALWMRVHGVRILLTVHEPFVDLDTVKHVVVGVVQRVMLLLLVTASEKVAVTTTRWTAMLSRLPLGLGSRVFHLPVGSSLACVGLSDGEREQLRTELGYDREDVVVAMMQPAGAGKLADLAMTVWREVGRKHPTLKLLIIGTSHAPVEPSPRIRDVGYVPAERASKLLQCADIFLMPFIDGVSSRRSSLMAAMAHGLPVVTTSGPLTDPVFASSPIVMRDPADTAGLVTALDELVTSPALRCRRSRDVRAFYLQHFDWPVLARCLNAEFGG
jgi:glycosyltransferase involved in cell wall biosynthesis